MSKVNLETYRDELPVNVRWPIKVNFVISKDLKSKIFHDIFKRYLQFDPNLLDVEISETPVEGADIYHYHRPHLEEELQTPAVVTVHHDPRDVDPWLDAKKFWTVYKQTARIVCLNSLQVEDLKAVDLTNTTVIPHGYDQKIFSRSLKTFSSDRKLNLGIVSKRYDRRFKGDAYMYELFNRLDVDRFRLTFVGAGRSVDAKLARQFGFEVDVFEFLPYRIFGSLYHDMDFLLMVSTYEGGPANLPEALASSTPILCTNVGMVPDLLKDGENGVVLTGDINKDIEVFERISANKDGFTQGLFDGVHGSQTAISWEEVIALHILMYAEILTEGLQVDP